MILDEIVAYKRQELAERRQAVPIAELRARVAGQPAALDFAGALAGPRVASTRREDATRRVSLIAEVKAASPSKGLLCPDFEPVRLAASYASNGASAISVLTDARFFHGSLDHLSAIRSGLPSPIPLLRKDFLFDPYQVYEARAYGADAVLLIVAILSDGVLMDLLGLTHELGMTALVEVHDEAELDRAVALGPRVIGINNRNLQDFSVDLATFERLVPMLPDWIIAVAESGVHTAADVRRVGAAGADAVLVGEALVTAPDVAARVRELAGAGQP